MTDSSDQNTDTEQPVRVEDLAHEIAALTWDLKGLNTEVIDVRGIVSYTDLIVITTGTSERQIQAIARHVESEMRMLGYRPLHSEGSDGTRWVLLDFDDVIVHIFHEEAREEYALERMWPDAPRVTFDDAPKALYGHFDMKRFN